MNKLKKACESFGDRLITIMLNKQRGELSLTLDNNMDGQLLHFDLHRRSMAIRNSLSL